MNSRAALALLFSAATFPAVLPSHPSAAQAAPQGGFGYIDFSAEAELEKKFLAVPDAKLAGEELKTLTAEPHLAAYARGPQNREYVARKFRAAGLETQIVPYRVLLSLPKMVRVEAYDEAGHLLMSRANTRTRYQRPPAGRSARGDALQQLFGVRRRNRRGRLRELRAHRRLQ